MLGRRRAWVAAATPCQEALPPRKATAQQEKQEEDGRRPPTMGNPRLLENRETRGEKEGDRRRKVAPIEGLSEEREF